VGRHTETKGNITRIRINPRSNGETEKPTSLLQDLVGRPKPFSGVAGIFTETRPKPKVFC